jgi:predicted enzyme related to lactoylglutathione lyase
MIRRINPVLLMVKDFRRSLEFYRDILGLKLISLEEVHEEFAAFEVGDITFAIHGGFEGRSGGAEPIQIHFEVDDIRSTVKALEAKGVKFLAPIEEMPYNAYETAFEDPDGNRFDVVQARGPGPIL